MKTRRNSDETKERPNYMARTRTNPNTPAKSIGDRRRSSNGILNTETKCDGNQRNLSGHTDDDVPHRVTRTSRSSSLSGTGTDPLPSSSRPPTKLCHPVLKARRKCDSTNSRMRGSNSSKNSKKTTEGDQNLQLVITLPYMRLEEVWDFLHPKKGSSRELEAATDRSIDINIVEIDTEIPGNDIGTEQETKYTKSSEENLIPPVVELHVPNENVTEMVEVEPSTSQMVEIEVSRSKPKPCPASKKTPKLSQPQFKNKPCPASKKISKLSQPQFISKPCPASKKPEVQHNQRLRQKPGPASRRSSTNSLEFGNEPGPSSRRLSGKPVQQLSDPSPASKKFSDYKNKIPKVKVNLVPLDITTVRQFQLKKHQSTAVTVKNAVRMVNVNLKRLTEEELLPFKPKVRVKKARRARSPSVEDLSDGDHNDDNYEPESDLHEPESVNVNRTTCNFCGYNAKSLKSLESHMCTHTGERPYKCRVSTCTEDFTCYEDKIQHERYNHRHLFRYQCERCKIGFQTESDYMNHTFTHPLETSLEDSMPSRSDQRTPDVALPCSHCPKIFTSVRGLQTHNRLMHTDNKQKSAAVSFSCSICPKTFPLRKALEAHKWFAHKTTDTQDNICSSRSPQTFSCSKCPKSFALRHALEVHLLFVHNTKLGECASLKDSSSKESLPGGACTVFCSKCPRWFKLKRNLELHMSLVHNTNTGADLGKETSGLEKDNSMSKGIGPPNTYICSQCPTIFERRDSLDAHVWAVHKINPVQSTQGVTSETEDSLLETRFCCSECPKTFPLRRGLEMHKSLMHKVKLNQNEKDKTYEKVRNEKLAAATANTDKSTLENRLTCGYCPKALFSVEELQEHMMSHSNVKTYGGAAAPNPLPFNCFYCTERFSSLQFLHEHSRKHLAERAKTCKTCGKIFERQEDLAVHEINHSREKLATCQYTKEGTTHRYLFTVHDEDGGPPSTVPGNMSGPSQSSAGANPAATATVRPFTGPAKNPFTHQPFLCDPKTQGNNTTGTFRFNSDQPYLHSDTFGMDIPGQDQGGRRISTAPDEATFHSTLTNQLGPVNLQIIEAYSMAARAGHVSQANRPGPVGPILPTPISGQARGTRVDNFPSQVPMPVPTPAGLPRTYPQSRRNSNGGVSGQGGQVHSVPALTFSCPSCPLQFFTQKYLDTHSAVHVKEKYFSCPHCPETFKYSSSLQLHQRVHSKEVVFACLECPAQYGTEEALTLHQICHQQRPGAVASSGLGSSSSSSTAVSTSTTVGAAPSTMDSTKLQCLYCRKPYQHATALAAHIRLHTGERPFQCEHCEMKFRSKRNLRKHTDKRHTHVQETDENYEDEEPTNLGDDYVNFEDEEAVGMINPESFVMMPTGNFLNLKYEGEEEEEMVEMGGGVFGTEDDCDNLEISAFVPQVILSTETDDREEETILIPELTLNDDVDEVIPELNVTTEMGEERESLVTPPPPPAPEIDDSVPTVNFNPTFTSTPAPPTPSTSVGDDFICGL